MARALVLVGFIVAITIAGVVAPAAAQENNTTATPAPNATATPAAEEFEPPGPYSIEDLRRRGTLPDGDPPDSIRIIERGGGAIGVRYFPVGPFSEPWDYLSPGTTVQSNRIQMYSVRFGRNVQPAEYTLRVVYWQPATKQIETEEGVTTIEYAANQTPQDHTLQLGRYYDRENVSLSPHFDRPVQVTMWLVDDTGRAVSGARWRFTHHSARTGQQAPVSSMGDLWEWVGTWILFPGFLGIGLGFYGAKRTLRRTGTGPRLGWFLWAFVVGLLLMIVLAMAYFETALILDQAPWIMGVSMGVIAYAAGLTMHPSVHELLFLRMELQDALPLRTKRRDIATDGGEVDEFMFGQANGDEAPESDEDESPDMDTMDYGGAGDDLDLEPGEYKEALYVDTESIPAVYSEEGWRIPRPGVRPFFARLWADAADLDDSEIKANIKGRTGTYDRIILTDPETEDPIEHEPARLEVNPTLFHERGPQSKLDPSSDREPDGVVEAVTDAFERLNWGYVAKLVAAVAIGFGIGGFLGVEALGFLIAGFGVLVASTEPVDGEMNFDPAPVHFTSVLATLTVLQRQYSVTATLEEKERTIWKERASREQEVEERLEDKDQTVLEEMFGPAEGFNLKDGEKQEPHE